MYHAGAPRFKPRWRRGARGVAAVDRENRVDFVSGGGKVRHTDRQSGGEAFVRFDRNYAKFTFGTSRCCRREKGQAAA